MFFVKFIQLRKTKWRLISFKGEGQEFDECWLTKYNSIMNKNTLIFIIAIILIGAGIYFYGDYNQKILPMQQIITIKTNFGDIKLELFEKDAPKTAANFIKLSKEGFYNGTRFHRVIKNFMIQGGDPNSKDNNWENDGIGGPGYVFEDEINGYKLTRGIIAMANSGPNTNGSQFFIVTAMATPWLDGKHTAFGKVVNGLDIIDKIENLKTFNNDNPQGQATIEKIIVD